MAVSTHKNVVSPKRMTAEEAAYLAGLIDGEGTIALRAYETKQGRRSHSFEAIACMSGTALALMEQVVEIAGNGWLARTEGNEKRKPLWKWSLSANQIRHVLPQVLCYLRLKRRQAEIVLRYLELVQGKRGLNGTELTELLALYEECAALNQRGPTRARGIQYEVADPVVRQRRTCAEEGCTLRCYAAHERCYQHWLEHRSPVIRTCAYAPCGAEFDAVRPRKRFCSNKCQWRAYREDVTVPKEQEARSEQRRKLCPGCQEHFEAEHEGRQYCSRSCYLKTRRAKETAARETVYDRTCEACGTAFRTNNPRKVYCRPACIQRAYQARKQTP